MKKAILILGSLTLTLNLLLGLLLSQYSYFNMGINCSIIILNTIALLSLFYFNMRNAFRISFGLLFSLLAISEIILGAMMPKQVQDNGYLIAIVILIFIETALFCGANILSNKFKN